MYKLMGFDFEIHYKPGATNKVVDALSRKIDSIMEQQVLQSSWSLPLEELNEEINNDQFIQQVKLDITKGNKSHVGYFMAYQRLLYKDRLVIPHNSKLIPNLLREFHDSMIRDHMGELITYQRLPSNGFGWE